MCSVVGTAHVGTGRERLATPQTDGGSPGGPTSGFERRVHDDKLAAPVASKAWFGDAVAVRGSETTALVGARGDDDPNGDGGGSTYLFDV